MTCVFISDMQNSLSSQIYLLNSKGFILGHPNNYLSYQSIDPGKQFDSVNTFTPVIRLLQTISHSNFLKCRKQGKHCALKLIRSCQIQVKFCCTTKKFNSE